MIDANSKREKRRDSVLSLLNAAIEAMNLAKEISTMTPAKAVFGSVGILLTMIRDSMVNKTDYVELGLACADVCKALERGVNEGRLDELSRSVCEAIEQLTRTVAEIQEKVIEKAGRNVLSRLLHASNDKDVMTSWKSDINRALHVFNTELAVNTHMAVLDIRRNVLAGRKGTDDQRPSVQVSIPPEELPPPPRTCFGREELIEEIISLAEDLAPIALIGVGGIGKTSIALTVLYHDRIEKRFGTNRRFIRCDQFPASRTHFLGRLSKVIGAGIENPEDLASLRPFLLSRETILFLDNAESLLDPQGPNAAEIYSLAEELSQLKTICLCITSRITTVPRHCKRLTIPTLSMESACAIFYGIYDNGGRSDIISDLLRLLDFHALSITLLATTASHNMWDYDRLAREWGTYRVQVLQTYYNESLAATIELSLASPTFRKLGPDASDLLSVTAFFPQGINENNLDWLFPTISNRRIIFDTFCILSLTHRRDGFITMLAPLRDYLRPKDPMSSPLLHKTKECYFRQLSVHINPGKPGFEEAQWIRSEDVNVEHLLDVFMSIDADPASVWDACAHFMRHLYWHKPRLVVLGSKIEELPDVHPSKPRCLFQLSRLFGSVGNHVERKRLLTCTLELWRERRNALQVARTLRFISDENRLIGLHKEGIQQVGEALEIYERLDNISGQAHSLHDLAWLLHSDKQLDAAEAAASRAIDLSIDKGEQFQVCQCHRLLGLICHSKGKTGEAVKHFQTAVGIASSSSWHNQLFWNNYSLAGLFFDDGRLEDAHTHIEHAKSNAINDTYLLGRTMQLQAWFWYKECRFEEAKSEALRAADVYEKIGATKGVEGCRAILRNIETEKENPATPGETFKARGIGSRLVSVFRRILS